MEAILKKMETRKQVTRNRRHGRDALPVIIVFIKY